MQELKQLDQVAYVRFASVYRQFRDIGEFKREVNELQKVRHRKVEAPSETTLARALAFVLVLRRPVRSAPRRPCRSRRSRKDGRVLVTFRMSDAFTEEVRAAMHSGLRITFVYDIELKRGTALWVDRTIATATVMATVEYDNLTRRYLATRREDGRMDAAETIEREDVARAWLTEFEKLPLFSSAGARAQRRVLPARPGPHDAAQRLVRVAVGRRHRRARQVHVSPVGRRAGARPPRHQPHEHYPRGDPPDAARPAARPRAPSGGRSATTRASILLGIVAAHRRSRGDGRASPTGRPSSTRTS